MPKAKRDAGDAELHRIFEEFNGQLISPGGAAALLGVSRKTVHTLGDRGKLRVLKSSEKPRGSDPDPRWVYIPLADYPLQTPTAS